MQQLDMAQRQQVEQQYQAAFQQAQQTGYQQVVRLAQQIRKGALRPACQVATLRARRRELGQESGGVPGW
jgi:hypothetical protein